ncbi:MAG TPA: hypothetical protein VJ623_02855 [Holophagaceae bacterium]|nr:hypothetical protein [Holophagaceae bacterium]
MDRAKIAVLAAAFSGLALQGQVQNRPQDWMTWDGSQIAVVRSGEARKLVLESPGHEGSGAKVLEGPEGTTLLEYKDHAAWASVRDVRHGTPAMYLYRSLDFKTWEVNATYSGDQGRARSIHHLDGKRYLLVSNPRFFTLGKRMSPYAIAEINEKGYLAITELVDLGLREPLVKASVSPGKAEASGEFNSKYIALLAMVLTTSPLRYPGGLALVARRPGYIWLLDDRTGAVTRCVKVFPGVSEEKLGPPHELEWGLLGCQPRPDGHLLIASREEAAVLTGMEAHPRNKHLSQLDNEHQQRVNVAQDQASISHWPTVLWWDLDPVSGKVTPEPAPQNVPHELLDLRSFQDFRFRFDIRGNLLVN